MNQELKLYIDNDGDIYRYMTVPINKNLLKKMQNETYRFNKSIKSFLNLCNSAAKKYCKEFSIPQKWNIHFPIQSRRETAEDMAKNFGNSIGGKNDLYKFHHGHFFDYSTMKFFKSRIGASFGRVFITSEKYRDKKRYYTIRFLDFHGDIQTFGKFQQYETLKQANKIAYTFYQWLELENLNNSGFQRRR